MSDEQPEQERPAERRSEEGGRHRGGRAAPPDGWGIVPGYEDAFGTWTDVSRATRERLVAAMGGDPAADGPPDEDPVLVIRVGDRPEVPGAVRLHREDGEVAALDGGPLPADIPLGYHDLELADGTRRRLIVSPGQALLPAEDGSWGWAAQLYAVWSQGSWGIGDLADLWQLARWSTSVGAGTLLINPLNAVTPITPRGTSPYYPTSRRFLDPLYLRVEQIPGAQTVAGLAALGDQARAAGGDRIDRDAVYAAKLAALEAIWSTADGVGQESDFLAYLQQREDLEAFGTYCTLAEQLGTGWSDWPEGFSHPDSAEVARFAKEHADRVRFHCWLQWQCETQLARAGEEIALLGDLPIGADPDGFDAWVWQDVLATGVTVGAPPDQLGPHGQNWMLPAFVPWKLRAARYEPFIALLRAAMRSVSGLRIDHVLGLFRLFWIPPGATATEGTYVRMPTDELLDILALESHRNDCFVVGEDLGTVEEGVRDELDARDILRYQVWWFEQDPVATWSPKALASVSTHDLPTIAGIWTGRDLEELRTLGQGPDGSWHAELRSRIAAAADVSEEAPVDAAIVGLHREVASAPNRIVVAQLDDALGVERRINVPGTDRSERPANWSQPLPVALEALAVHATVDAVTAAMVAGRAARAGGGS